MGGQYVSSLTAEYPESLATALAERMAPFVSSIGHRNAPISHFANLLPEPLFIAALPSVMGQA